VASANRYSSYFPPGGHSRKARGTRYELKRLPTASGVLKLRGRTQRKTSLSAACKRGRQSALARKHGMHTPGGEGRGCRSHALFDARVYLLFY